MALKDPKDPPEAGDGLPASNVSRREFLRTAGVGGLVTAVMARGEAEAQPGVRAVGPGEVPVTLTINGTKYTLTIEPRVTLLDAVRNRLDMTGVKRVCDRGSCGACTMIVDGRSIYSCSVLAIEMQGKAIRTIEGLAQGTVLHPVQQAFADHDALMCGFCTPGFVMAAVALLEKTPNPTREQVLRGLDGNICRCGTYTRLVEATLAATGVRRG